MDKVRLDQVRLDQVRLDKVKPAAKETVELWKWKCGNACGSGICGSGLPARSRPGPGPGAGPFFFLSTSVVQSTLKGAFVSKPQV